MESSSVRIGLLLGFRLLVSGYANDGVEGYLGLGVTVIHIWLSLSKIHLDAGLKYVQVPFGLPARDMAEAVTESPFYM